jgi:hypothetical protein
MIPQMEGGSFRCVAVAPTISPKIPFECLVSKIVKGAEESTNSIDINFEDGTTLKIDMRPQAYRGPEAMELNRVGFPTVIWKFAHE